MTDNGLRDSMFGDPRLPERFWEKVRLVDGPLETPCWKWVAASDQHGYGRYGRPTKLAHRVAYESLVGSTLGAPHLDHLCREPSCVNPEHLERVTARENILRGIGPTAVNARKTHCLRGHLFDENNTRIERKAGRTPSRACRECSRLKSSEKYYENREAINLARKLKYHERKKREYKDAV